MFCGQSQLWRRQKSWWPSPATRVSSPRAPAQSWVWLWSCASTASWRRPAGHWGRPWGRAAQRTGRRRRQGAVWTWARCRSRRRWPAAAAPTSSPIFCAPLLHPRTPTKVAQIELRVVRSVLCLFLLSLVYIQLRIMQPEGVCGARHFNYITAVCRARGSFGAATAPADEQGAPCTRLAPPKVKCANIYSACDWKLRWYLFAESSLRSQLGLTEAELNYLGPPRCSVHLALLPSGAHDSHFLATNTTFGWKNVHS